MLSQSLFISECFSSTVGKVTLTADQGQKVKVYRNLNKPEYYSIQATEGADKNKVIGYAKCIWLTDVTFKVSEASRQRVIRQGRKNVHAVCIGILADASNTVLMAPRGITATYNPYAFSHFFNRETKQPVNEAYANAVFQGANVYLFDHEVTESVTFERCSEEIE
ncbi:MAG: hypothetical protein ACI9FJ_001032 [Alteromonadaceae bacterium]|jgi:hypothetical protein